MKCFFDNCLTVDEEKKFVFNDLVCVCEQHLDLLVLDKIESKNSCSICSQTSVVCVRNMNTENTNFCELHFDIWKNTKEK